MRLIISKLTDSVYKDGISILNLGLFIPDNVRALYWDDASGWIESNEPTVDISELPQWALDCLAKYEKALPTPPAPPIPPTPQEVNKQKAMGLLSESDFSVLPDVNLTNKAAWETYRANIRAIAINPTIDPTWPIKPPELWS